MEREEDKKSSLTSALIQIPPENEAVSSNGINEVRRKKIIWAEVKKQVWLAGPLTGLGMATALDTLFGQSYGAKQYSMLGIHMQRAMLIL
ncbi:hypothetical protein Goari_012910, partial [Gossypium aridum]|nr:hypothetical protein [Gossypium aridum]